MRGHREGVRVRRDPLLHVHFFYDFSLLNVLTGVVLDTATKCSRREGDKLMTDEILNAFRLNVDDLTREIGVEEFEASTREGGMRNYFEMRRIG